MGRKRRNSQRARKLANMEASRELEDISFDDCPEEHEKEDTEEFLAFINEYHPLLPENNHFKMLLDRGYIIRARKSKINQFKIRVTMATKGTG